MRLTPIFACLLPLAAQSPVLLNNDLVRVVKASNTPGQKSRMHRHTVNRVMVHLNAGHMRLTSDTGEARDIRFRDGEVRWDPAGGLHTSENMGPGSYQIVEIELKKPAGAKVDWPALDPVRVDPKQYTIEFENDQVRVTRCRFAPGGSTPTHEHQQPRVVVHLTPMNLRQTLPDGSTREAKAEAGGVSWGTAAKHSEVNLSTEVFEVVVVEVKP